MYLPELQEGRQETLITTTFLGYNYHRIIQDGEMYDMGNLCGDSYPLLTTRRKRAYTVYPSSEPLQAIHGRDKLVMIRNNKVYYNGNNLGLTTTGDMPKKIVNLGAYTCIWPDKIYFNTADLSDKGSMEIRKTLNGMNIQVYPCKADGTNYDMTKVTVGANPPSNPANGAQWIDTSGDKFILKQYAESTKEWGEVYTTYVKLTGAGIGAGVREYDVLTIKGLTAENNADAKVKQSIADLNGDKIIYGAGDNYIILAGIISRIEWALNNTVCTFVREVPDLDYICESNNRLWGCKFGLKDGQMVNEIRACKLGDFRNWNCYMGLSSDSYAVSVGTDGEFTAAVSQRGYPVFFKEDCIHRISGSSPSSFQMTTTMCRGVENGAWRTAQVVNEAIIYKSRDGVMIYDGSIPVMVSDALGVTRYKGVSAGVNKGMYYICLVDSSDWPNIFKYDVEKQLWYKEDGFHAPYFARVGESLYAIADNHGMNVLYDLMGRDGTLEGDRDWWATFGMFGTDYTNQKYLSRFNIRMSLAEGKEAHLYIKYDNDKSWTDEGRIKGSSTQTFMIPVVPRRCDHLQFKIEGKGDVTIYSISRVLEIGGDG